MAEHGCETVRVVEDLRVGEAKGKEKEVEEGGEEFSEVAAESVPPIQMVNPERGLEVHGGGEDEFDGVGDDEFDFGEELEDKPKKD